MRFVGMTTATSRLDVRAAASGGRARRASAVRCELRRAGEAASIAEAWSDLERRAAFNPFFTRALLEPALKRLAGPEVRLLCAWRGSTLVGLAPMAPARGYARLPMSYWRTWVHPHCFYGAPLVRPGEEAAFAEAVAMLADRRPGGAAFMRLELLDADGPLATALRALGARADDAQRVVYDAGAHDRAALYAGETPDAYLAGAIRTRKRKELRRLSSRLAEIGSVRFETLVEPAHAPRWAEDFMALEAAGWKGSAGTALAARPEDRAYFTEALDRAAHDGLLRLHRLSVNGRTIAMIVCFERDGEGYSFKIAHDPAFDRFSPGVMIEIELTRAALADATFRMMDSCATPDHPMINRLWRSRRRLTGLNISGRRLADRGALALARSLENASAVLRRRRAGAAPVMKDEDDVSGD